MAQRLVSISRDRADRFSGASVHRPNVQVIAERRRTERRQRNVPASIERRRGDRRRVNIDNYLRHWLGRSPRRANATPGVGGAGTAATSRGLSSRSASARSRTPAGTVTSSSPGTTPSTGDEPRRLLDRQGRREEARRVIPPEIYGWFTEGFDTADLC